MSGEIVKTQVCCNCDEYFSIDDNPKYECCQNCKLYWCPKCTCWEGNNMIYYHGDENGECIYCTNIPVFWRRVQDHELQAHAYEILNMPEDEVEKSYFRKHRKRKKPVSCQDCDDQNCTKLLKRKKTIPSHHDNSKMIESIGLCCNCDKCRREGMEKCKKCKNLNLIKN